MVTCPSLKPIHKNRGEEMKFTFDFSKCDRIFDELLKFGYIRINYTLSSADELKKELIVNIIILFLMPLMIAMFSVGRSNRPLMRDD
jgi:hypothetical protein